VFYHPLISISHWSEWREVKAGLGWFIAPKEGEEFGGQGLNFSNRARPSSSFSFSILTVIG
jgi:hypothetical protein